MFKDNEGIVLIACETGYNALSYASDRLKDDKDFILKVVTVKPNNIKHASERLKSDREVGLALANEPLGTIYNLNSALRDDKEIVLAAVKHYTYTTYPCVSDRLKDDIDVARAVHSYSTEASQFSSERLQQYLKLADKGIKTDPDSVLEIWLALWKNKKERQKLTSCAIKHSARLYEDFAACNTLTSAQVIAAVKELKVSADIALSKLETDKQKQKLLSELL